MLIEPNEIQLWIADLEELKAVDYFALLSEDEHARAKRFHFQNHSQRFTAARGMLRILLSLYVKVEPQKIVFSYTSHKKPLLHYPPNTNLEFNVSHSGQMAVYAFTLQHAIGVDIEQIQPDYHPAVAQRFFSQQEYHALLDLPVAERPLFFYRIWASKEALVKATGKGLSTQLSSISIPVNDDFANIIMNNNESWSLFPLTIHPAYQSAVATRQRIRKITYWQLENNKPVLKKTELF